MPGRTRFSRALRPISVMALAGSVAASLLAPAGVAATSPPLLSLDQATASTIADRWFPIVRNVDVPPGCGEPNALECPGGVPVAASTNLRLTRASLSATLQPPSTFEVSAGLRVETLDPIAINVSGVDCTLSIDSSSGTSTTIQVATPGTVVFSQLLGYNYVVQGDINITGLEPDDVVLAGGLLCTSFNLILQLAFDLLEGLLGDMLRAEGPICGAPAPTLLVTCPWLTVDPPTPDFGEHAIGTSTTQLVSVINVGPGFPYAFEMGQVAIEGLASDDFAITLDNCSGEVVMLGGCGVEVTFTPSASGERTARLLIPNSWPDGPSSIELRGSGSAPADLAIGVTAAQSHSKGGARLTYVVTVSNAGPSTATGITIADSLPPQTTFVSASASLGSCTTPAVGASGSVSCSFSSLASGSGTQIQIVLAVTARKTSITNTVSVASATFDPVESNNTASVTTRIK